MKRLFKKILSGIFFSLLLFSSISKSQGSTIDTVELLPIETWITDLSWEKYESTYIIDNRSKFVFDIKFMIYNPNDVNITTVHPYQRQFYGNMTIELEDPNHNASLYHGGEFCAISERTFEPGYENDTLPYLLISFDTQNLDQFPDGNYSIWVYCGDQMAAYDTFYSYRTNFTVENGVVFIDYFITTIPTPPPTTPSFNIGISLSIISISAFGISSLIYAVLSKKKKAR